MTKTQNPQTLYLSSLKASHVRLVELMQKNKTELVQLDIVRAFDSCYELSCKVMQEFLNSAGVVANFPNEVFYESEKAGIIKNANLWLNFLGKRNSIAYAYDPRVLKEIIVVVLSFEGEVESLVRALEKRSRC